MWMQVQGHNKLHETLKKYKLVTKILLILDTQKPKGLESLANHWCDSV